MAQTPDADATTVRATPPSLVAETEYELAELVASARAAFGVLPEVVAGALHLAGRTRATRAQVEAALATFQTWRP